MPEALRYDGRVAVVTGAGAGLGRAYALLFASRGASVVVNDLGGGRHGDGSSTRAADAVVNEIRAAGGKAVANYDSVEDGEKIIQTALENFGRVDIVVNNAGILRDKSFARISDTDWDLIHQVHLKGSFKTTQAAWPHFRKQNYGRIIMTSSNSGIYGNFGQANYSAAKLGLVGLSNTVAIEGRKNNIHCNVIVPTAASRLTEDILPPEFFAELRPELIAPVVAYLCHESCEDNGSVIEAAAGWAGKCHIIRSKGGLLRSKITDNVTIEDVQRNWGTVTDMSNASRCESIGEASGTLMGVLEEMKENAQSGPKPKEVVDHLSYTSKDLILYALGVGSSVTQPEDMRFLYENHEDFTGLPTFLIIPGQMAFMMSGAERIEVPGKTVSLAQILHGEQYLEVYKPLPSSGSLESRCSVVDVIDKGKGAVAIVNMETFDETGEKLSFAQMTVFIVGAGGFGGPRNSAKAVLTADPPKRSPDTTIRQKTSLDQAALYRLSGDLNPLHIDESMAAMGGFAKPILHGLCSLGFSARHVLLQYANNDAKLFKSIKARFAKPVMPGQTLQTDMWREGNRIHFQTSVVENGSIVISGAYVDLHEVIPRINPNNVAAIIPVLVSADSLQSDAVFEEIKKQIEADPAAAKQINAVFLYNITKDGKNASKWTLDLKKPNVYSGDPQGVKADTTFTVADQDFVDLATGKLNPQVAFMKGKLKITGNIMLAEKMRAVLKQKSKL